MSRRTLLATEPVERFFVYGRPILAPADGTVVEAHDGEIDHVGRRSQWQLDPAHVHVHVMDSRDLSVARGIPMAFRHFPRTASGAKQFQMRESGHPGEGGVIEPLPPAGGANRST